MSDSSPDPSPEGTDPEWPVRRLRDAGAVRAMAHPLRLRIIELLGVHGPATATELAARLGESPANCSWHLRQLAAHGFIEETGQGRGRQRYWRFVPSGHTVSAGSGDAEVDAAGQSADAVMLEYVFAELRQWRADRAGEPDRWREAAFSGQAILWLTPEELTELGEQIQALFQKQVGRHFDPESRPPGARPIRLYATGIPSRPLEND